MHHMIEEARKSAGIGNISKKNYPIDPKQRGCGHWAAFLGALDAGLEKARVQQEEECRRSKDEAYRLRDEDKQNAKDHEVSIRDMQIQLTESNNREHALIAEVERLQKEVIRKGMSEVGHREGWSPDKRLEMQELVIAE